MIYYVCLTAHHYCLFEIIVHIYHIWTKLLAKIPPNLGTNSLLFYNRRFAIKAKQKKQNYILMSLVMSHWSIMNNNYCLLREKHGKSSL